MYFEESFKRRYAELLNDKSICKPNKDLFKEFFEWEEYKLKRINNLSKLDERSYKTMLDYVSRFRTINKWFKNKDWKKLTEQEIKKVYDDLEDGKLKTKSGKPYVNRVSIYNKVFKSKPFELAGKKEICRKIMEFHNNNKEEEVSFIEYDDFMKLIRTATKPTHKLLFWLAFDIGENVTSLLELRKKDFVRQINPTTKDGEYIVNLAKENLKRKRRARGEITNFKETAELLDMILEDLKDEDKLFNFEYRNAKKIFDKGMRLTKIKCKPKGQTPTWKDLRSSMACYLLKSGWTSDEVNSRLGHKPSSRELDKYINHLALNRHSPKKRLYDNTLEELKMKLEEKEKLEKLNASRLENQKRQLEEQEERLKVLEDLKENEILLAEKNKKGYSFNMVAPKELKKKLT